MVPEGAHGKPTGNPREAHGKPTGGPPEAHGQPREALCIAKVKVSHDNCPETSKFRIASDSDGNGEVRSVRHFTNMRRQIFFTHAELPKMRITAQRARDLGRGLVC